MKIVLTVVLAAIILAAVWGGYRRGLILSAAQLAAIVVAFYGAALLAGRFPTASCRWRSRLPADILRDSSTLSQPVSRITTPASRGEDWVDAHPDTAEEYTQQCFAAAGVSGREGQRMARQALALRDAQELPLRTAMTQLYCARLCYVLVTAVGFLLFDADPFRNRKFTESYLPHPEPGSGSTILAVPPSARSTACALASCCAGHCSLPGPSSAATRLRTPLWQKALQAIDVLTLGASV